ncbi:MAG: hybrid sensor histidine kinase/response regulator [bacterium]|nr:hybrid sensor histidine kinase/response regulator [bacterium]
MRPADDNDIRNASRNASQQPHVPAEGDAAGLHAAGVVHDVNQMLAVITGRAELLLRHAPELRPHLEAILLAAREAGGMLERLGGGAEWNTGTPGPPTAVVAAAVNDVAQLVLPPDGCWREVGAGTEGWELSLQVAPMAAIALPPAVLREVLVNLFFNAIGVLPHGGRLQVSAEVSAGVCRVQVADSGPGLPVSDPEAVFAVGFSTSGTPGRGLGLAACRQLLAAHGASLVAARDGGPGAVFTISGPAAAPDPVAIAAPATTAPAGAHGLAVVVIDDEPAVREMLTDVLGELGCLVTCHRDGATALAAGAPGDAAVALVDRRLPGLGGLEVAAGLRERRASLVIVMMSGWDRDEPVSAPAVVDFTVRKPLAMSVLQQLLAEARALHESRVRAETSAPGGT